MADTWREQLAEDIAHGLARPPQDGQIPVSHFTFGRLHGRAAIAAAVKRHLERIHGGA